MWNFCVQHAIHLINRLPTPLLNSKCPHEVLFSEPPSLIHLKVFGCLGYASTLTNHRTKFDSRARKCIFLGYKDGTKGFILYDLHSNTTFVSRNVVFYENTFPFKTAKASSQNTQPFVDSHLTPFDDITNTPHTAGPTDMTLDNSNNPFVIPLPNDSPRSDIDVSLGSATPTTDSNNHTPLITNDQTFTSTQPIHTDTNSSPQSNTQTTPTTQSATPLPDTDSNHNAIVPLRQSTRNSNPPSYLNDYHCYSAYNALHSLHPFEHHIKYPLSSVLTYNKCAPSYKHFYCTISSNTEPKTFSQANKLDCWRKAINVELLALAENHTWDVVDLPHGTLDVSSYYTQLTSLWEQIYTYYQTRDYTCAIPCSCGAVTDLRKFREQDKVLKFLKGLNEQYCCVRSQIMILDPLPSMEKNRPRNPSVHSTSAELSPPYNNSSYGNVQDQYHQLINLIQQHFTNNTPQVFTPLESDAISVISSSGNFNSISTSLVFYEIVFPLHNSTKPITKPTPLPFYTYEADLEPFPPPEHTTPYIAHPNQPTSPAPPIHNSPLPHDTPSPPPPPIPIRQSTRTNHPPTYLKDYCWDLLHPNPSINITSHGNPFPLSSVLYYDNCFHVYKKNCLSISSMTEPKTYNQANKLDCWKNAMKTELDALISTNTWSIVDLPHNKTPIGCKWIYKIKYNADGLIERYKAYLVGK
ncbi:hypothetical protein KIW84_043041 [Lathyrus oleraceus]|uniref:Retroviral polymerase SH3-like domain-containing protein n=1 Tax=Pisum sativum TaxID=3888 RepID=A0A9D4XCJ8_PEA|nr:hypothetical protein KIW84_043041 [Pisum sativum]